MTALEDVLAGEAFLLFDGGMGTMIHARGLKAPVPESLDMEQPGDITAIHAAYVAAGADAITTNTFGANELKLARAGMHFSVPDIIQAATTCARESGAAYVAYDIGPIGELLEPMGTLTFDAAYALFAEQVDSAVASGADLIIIETMTDALEAKAALLAAKEHSTLPVFATMSFDAGGHTFIGVPAEVGITLLQALGADAVGMNCSVGPDELYPIVARAIPFVRLPFIVQANAGMPSVVEGETVYSITAEDYAAGVERMIEAGVSILGGCCGTTPENIAALRALIDRIALPRTHEVKECRVISSNRSFIEVATDADITALDRAGTSEYDDILAGSIAADIADGDYDFFIDGAMDACDDEADIFCINLTLPGIDEAACAELVKEVQAVAAVPFEFIGSDLTILEAALRHYNGLPLLRFTGSGSDEADKAAALARKYGATLVR